VPDDASDYDGERVLPFRQPGLGSLLAAIGGVALAAITARTASAQTLRRPVPCDGCISNYFYFDDSPTETVEDWSCARSSYDGHRGTDFSLRGGLAEIDTGHDVVAAADGVVDSAQDGYFDRCTMCGGTGCGLDFGGGFGNHVVITHGAHKVVYAHLRSGSVRVAPGDRVACGEVLGQIGSSGCSRGAHLHFETRPAGGASRTAFDPYAGDCSPTSPSLWTEQGAHRALPGSACARSCGGDAGCVDAGEELVDAGAPPRTDASASSLLDASALSDASIEGNDAIASDDAARVDGGASPEIGGGCGCGIAGRERRAGATMWLALILALHTGRRRSRARARSTRTVSIGHPSPPCSVSRVAAQRRVCD
jgi:murein DD-endopeptidase MepM/ murein hydrolase activator NlpD